MGKYTKKITETNIRIGEVRFSYANVFAPRKSDDSSDGKYSVCFFHALMTRVTFQPDGKIDALRQELQSFGISLIFPKPPRSSGEPKQPVWYQGG